VFSFKGGTHLNREFKEVGVSGDLLFRFLDEERFLEKAHVHFFDVILKKDFVLFELSDGLFKFGLEVLVVLNFGVFGVGVVGEGVLDVFVKLVEHGFDSVNGTGVKEHVDFRGGHLGEESDNWGVVLGETNFDTGSKHLHGVGGKLDEVSINNHVIEDGKSTCDNAHGISVVLRSGLEKLMFGFSSGSSSGKGSSGVGDVLDGHLKGNLGLVQ
jgi:hypothetical protein